MAMKRKPEIRVAFIDIDGTLIRDNFTLYVVQILHKKGVIRTEHYRELENVLRRWQERKATYDDLTSELLRTIRHGLEGVTLEDLLEAGQQAAAEGLNRPYLFTHALLEVLKSMQPKPLLVAISGSPRAVVQPYCDALGFDDVHATMFKLENGKITGGYELATSPYHTKDATCIRAAQSLNLPIIPVVEIDRVVIKGSLAIGDALADHKMFDVVEYPIAFNPTAQLLSACREHSTPVVTERKDVINISRVHWGERDAAMAEIQIEEILPIEMARQIRRRLPGLFARV
jgi:phosphoserine phosphatase